jgi:serine/threonine-protein kinase
MEQAGKPAETAYPQIPGYDILMKLGEGAMGVVYQARRHKGGSLVALKTIRPAVKPTEVTLARFLREANILKELDHPNIVAFRDMGHAQGRLYFVMDFIVGTDAGELLKREGPFPVGRAVSMVCQLLEALAYAHARGFVHRDVKPSNLMVTRQQEREIVKLADFGLARTYQASQLSGLTVTGGTGGTPAYMPPEQVLDFRTVKPAADQYSAAATLYRLLTDKPMYDGIKSSMDLMMKVLSEEPVPVRARRTDLPAGLAAAIQKALTRSPEGRFADVSAFRQALVPFAQR